MTINESKVILWNDGGNSDCFIDFKKLSLGALSVSGRLGATFSSHSLTFEFVADQTLLEPLVTILRRVV